MSRAGLAAAANLLDPPPEPDAFALVGYEPCQIRFVARKNGTAADELPEPCGQCPQELLHDATEFDVGFGGQLGGGKSMGLLMDAIRNCVRYPGFKACGFRNTYPQIEESFLGNLERIDFAKKLKAAWIGGVHELRFPHGGLIRFRYADTLADAKNRHGGEYQEFLLDERQFLDPAIPDYLQTRLRSSTPRIPVVGMRSSFNPGEVGGPYIKERYIDATDRGQIIYEDVVDGNPTGIMVRFIPAPPNPALDAGYWDRLNAIKDPEQRRAYQEGDWDALPNMMFSQWRYAVHVVKPEDFPISLGGVVRGIGIDYGNPSPFAALWGAVTGYDGLVVVYREAYDTHHTATMQAEKILGLEDPQERLPGRRNVAWADPAVFAAYPDEKRIPGVAPRRSVAADYAKAGLPVRPAMNDRIAGVRVVHDALRVREDGRPRLLVYSTCTNLIKYLPSLPRDPRRPDDVLKCATDHIYDSLRYLLCGLLDVTPTVTKRGPGAPRTTTAAASRAGF